MTKRLILLNEAALRFRVVAQHAQVYFQVDPETVLGSQFLGKVEDTNDHQHAWDLIDRYLGHLMPADLVDEEFLERFDGIAYIGGGFAYVNCPNCFAVIQGDDLHVDQGHHQTTCQNCGTPLVIERSVRLPSGT